MWDCVENRLDQMTMKTLKTSQTLDYLSGASLSLQAHRHLHDRLQVGMKHLDGQRTFKGYVNIFMI